MQPVAAIVRIASSDTVTSTGSSDKFMGKSRFHDPYLGAAVAGFPGFGIVGIDWE
jgi:hypothetical protein